MNNNIKLNSKRNFLIINEFIRKDNFFNSKLKKKKKKQKQKKDVNKHQTVNQVRRLSLSWAELSQTDHSLIVCSYLVLIPFFPSRFPFSWVVFSFFSISFNKFSIFIHCGLQLHSIHANSYIYGVFIRYLPRSGIVSYHIVYRIKVKFGGNCNY